MIKKLVKNIASSVGIDLSSEYSKNRQKKYAEILKRFESIDRFSQENSCEIIIFSKDRAIQLDALIRSYFQYVKNPAPLQVLYHCSTEGHTAGYAALALLYSEKKINFIAEKNFKNDLVNTFKKITANKVLFLVDDIFFKNELDLNEFLKIDLEKFVPSLRMGNHLSFSYTVNKKQKLPKFDAQIQANMLSWNYQTSELDWAYPLSVDGHLFDAREMNILVQELEYTAPNSFEEALQLMIPYYSQRLGLCYENSIIVNNPCNKVQEENDNIAGEISIDELNKKWLDGYRIDFEKHKGIENKSCHQELTVDFVKR